MNTNTAIARHTEQTEQTETGEYTSCKPTRTHTHSHTSIRDFKTFALTKTWPSILISCLFLPIKTTTYRRIVLYTTSIVIFIPRLVILNCTNSHCCTTVTPLYPVQGMTFFRLWSYSGYDPFSGYEPGRTQLKIKNTTSSFSIDHRTHWLFKMTTNHIV